MRQSPIIDALFPNGRGKILAATLMHPEKQWYLSQLARFLHTRPSSLQREVEALSKAGILKQSRDGRRTYLKADTDSPVFVDLKSLFEKTAGIVFVLQQAIEPVKEKIQIAFVYGSVARSEESSESDVDLLVVGSLGLADLVPVLRSIEQTLGRRINPTVFSVEEFTRKARQYDHFLTAVLHGEKIFIEGEHELAELYGQG